MTARILATWAVGTAVLATPIAAVARDSAITRPVAPETAANDLGGDNSTLFFLGAIVAVAIGIFLLIDDDDAESA